MSEVIKNHAIWLDRRSKLLARYFHEPAEDCYQALCLQLLTYNSQATAWRKVFSDLQRAEQHQRNFCRHSYTAKQKPQAAPSESVDRADLLDYLSPQARQCVKLYWGGFNRAEISEKLKVSESSVKRLLHRSLASLAEILGES